VYVLILGVVLTTEAKKICALSDLFKMDPAVTIQLEMIVANVFDARIFPSVTPSTI